MNNDLSLCEILRTCPKGMRLYSPVFGNVTFDSFGENFSIICRIRNGKLVSFRRDGTMVNYEDAECVLFPSREQRDWSKFEVPEIFNPDTLERFDKVLVRDIDTQCWHLEIFDRIKDKIVFYLKTCSQCIPYNDKTEHLLDTKDDCPEYYKWWELMKN